MNKPQLTKITFQTDDRIVSWEVPYNDVSGNEVVEAFAGLMITQTFMPETVYRCMKDYGEIHLDDETVD